MENPSLLCYITYYLHQTNAIQYFSIIELINQGHIFNFHKGFCMILSSDNEQKAATLAHSAQKKHKFLVKMKEKSKSQKLIPKNKFLWNDCIRDQDTGPKIHYWMDILQIFVRTLRSGQILTISEHHVRYQQYIKSLDQRHL